MTFDQLYFVCCGTVAALVGLTIGLHFAVRAMRKHLPELWRLIDPKTLPTCPTCGKDAEHSGVLLVCRDCDCIIGTFR